MTDTVICPECHQTATVVGRFTLTTPSGPPVEYLRIRCSGLLTVLVTADEAPDYALASAG
ncbi:hypothetical protein ACQEVB_14780 [Pseudonocardia sp. CA-107938]|uniref:hypothetical protein n=1 Tax=Pseudonocardia sp. CA-107938 TaxID=3240021 RepID=UPI003D938E0B